LAHSVFLSRITDQPPTSADVRLAQGAFLTLRLVDLLTPERRAEPDVFQYQWTATDRYISELLHDGPEAAHLSGLVRAARESYQRSDVGLLIPELFAYVYHLERSFHLEEALDVTETILLVGRGALSKTDAIAAHLRLGLLNRSLARFDTADAQYRAAEDLALQVGDRHSALLSRIGRVIALQQRGNLAECESTLRSILVDARAAGSRDAEARAEHVLGNLLQVRGMFDQAPAHLWQAYTLYEDDHARARALGDLGIALLRLGQVGGAEQALREVVRTGVQHDVVANAQIELMHCASYRRDRITFERYAAECENRLNLMTPGMVADFRLKGGIGYARFGQYRKAHQLMDQALGVAIANRLHELEFRIERIKAGLDDCEEVAREGLQTTAEPVLQNDELRELSESLAHLGA
jgi:tetratricopeptide (TPR) repeat protein